MTPKTCRMLLEQVDWSDSPLGARDQWPPEMLAVIDTALHSGFPVCTAWGASQTQIYNDAYIPILGQKHPQAFGATVAESWPEIQPFLGPALQRVTQTGEPLWFHQTLLALARHGAPEECWFDFSYSLVRRNDGHPLGVISIAVEKTQEVVFARRQKSCDLPLDALAEGGVEGLALHLGQCLASNTMDAAGAILFSSDGPSGRAGRTLWAAPGDSAALEVLRDATPDFHSCMFVQELTRWLPALPEGWADRVLWLPLRDPVGQPLAALALVPNALVPESSHGDFARQLADRLHRVLHHAQALGQARRQLKAQDQLYRFLFENVVDAVISASLETQDGAREIIRAANPGACRLLGYETHELVGLDRDRLFSDGYELLREALRERAATGVFIGELVLQRKDGQPVPCEITSRLVTSANGHLHSVNIVRDITLRLAQETERANHVRHEAIAQITGGVAHDFNNLLTVMLGSLEMLQDELPVESRGRLYVANALMCAERGASLTSQLLAYARRQPARLVSVDLNAHLQEMAALIRSSLGEINALQLLTGEEVPACDVDVAQLTAALINLAVNARDAMPDGGTLTIACDRFALPAEPDGWSLPPDEYVRLRVSDTGTGVPAALAARIFEPYFTTKAPGAGTGLGLAMVRGFVRQCGGEVRVASMGGDGAMFEILIPVAHDQRTASAVTAFTVTPAGEHILLVEDNDLVRSQVSLMLTQAGYHVTQAASGRAGLEHIARGQVVDVVLTDLVMPGGQSGLQMAHEIRRHHPALPILVMTGHDPWGEFTMERDRQFEVIGKPFERERLLAALARLLGSRREARLEERSRGD